MIIKHTLILNKSMGRYVFLNRSSNKGYSLSKKKKIFFKLSI